MTSCCKELLEAYIARISGPVGAPSAKHVISDEFSIVRMTLTQLVGDQVHLGFLQVLRVASNLTKKHRIDTKRNLSNQELGDEADR